MLCLHAAAKVIILVSAGVKSDSESVEEVQRTIDTGKRLAGDVTIVAFGLNTGSKVK